MLSVSALDDEAKVRLTSATSGGLCAASSRASSSVEATTGLNPSVANDCARPSRRGSSLPARRICVIVFASPRAALGDFEHRAFCDTVNLDDLRSGTFACDYTNVASRDVEDLRQKFHELLIRR